MAKQSINVGTSPNDNRGDSLRISFQKINANFTELYNATGGGLDLLNVASSIIPSATNIYDLGSPTRQWRSLYVSTSTIYLGGTALSIDGSGNLTVGGSRVGATSYTDLTGKPALSTVATTGSYTDLTNRPTLFSGSYADLTNKPNLAGTYQFSVAADDSTQRVISTDEVVKFVGAGGITTASDAEGKITITQGTTSSLVNGSKTVSLGTNSTLTLPAPLVHLTNASQLATDTAKIYRATNSTDATAITEAWDTWYGYEWVFRTYVQEDENGRGSNFPWHGMPSWEAYPLIMNWNSQGGPGLPPNPSMAPAAKTAQDSYLAYKELVSSIDIVNGNKIISFNNTGVLSLPGTLEFKDTANAKIILKHIDPFGYVVEDPTLDKTWTFGNDGTLNLPETTSAGNSIVQSTYNVQINSNSKLWTFGTDGVLTLPNGAKIGPVEFPNGNDFYSTGEDGYSELNWDNTNYAWVDNLGTTISSTGKNWQFGTDGALTLPGDIKSNGNINIDINLADSTLRRWQFGEDGDTTFPGVINAGNINNLVVNDLGGGTSLTAGSQVQIGNSAGIAGAGVIIKNSVTNTLDGEFSSTLESGSKIQMDNGNVSLFGYEVVGFGGESPSGLEGRLGVEVDNSYLNKVVRIGTRTITTNGGDTITSFQGVTFSRYGELTFPDNTVQTTAYNPSNIRSEGNINIEVNLSDSTLRRWQFGEDGNLNLAGPVILPNGGELRPSTAAYDTALAGWETIRGGEIANRIAIGQALVQYYPMVNWYPTGATAQGYIDFLATAFALQSVIPAVTLTIQPAMSFAFYNGMRAALIAIRDSYNTSTTAVSLSSAYGKSWNFGADGALTLPGDIKSNGNINIDINLSDSTLRRWSFGEDGILTLPSVGKISNGAYDWTFGSNGNTTFPTGLVLGAPRGPNTVNFTCAIDKSFQIETGTSTTGKLWSFGTDGSLTLPGDIKSNGNINIDINLGDSTLRRWQFGEDGILTLPSVGKISNGAYDWTFGTDGKLTAPGNLEVDGGRVILHPYGNAYIESVDYGVNSADSAVNIFGGPYQKIKLRAGFGTEAAWTFGTDGKLTVPGDIESTTSLDIITNHIPYYSNQFSGSQYISIANSSALQLGNATSWTIEAWVYITAYPVSGTMTIIEKDAQIAVSYSTYLLNIASDGKAAIYTGYGGGGDNNPTGKNVVSSTNLPLNQWVHLAAVWNGSNITLYQNGVSVGTVSAATTPITGEGGRAVNIGREDYLKYFTGKISNVRIVKNTAVYTGAFTPSTSPLTSIANTSLLTCNAATINVGTGTATVVNESPFGVYGDKTWAFGTDGSLTLPIGVSIDSNVSSLYPKIIADSGKLFSVQGQGSTGSAAMAWSLNPNTDTQYAAVGVNRGGGDDLAKVVLTAGNTTATLKVWKFDQTGAFTFPDATVQTTAWTGTTTGAITAERFNTDQITLVGNRISTTLTNANLEIECNGTGGVVINTVADATTASTVKSVGYLGLPQSATATTATLAIGDAGKHIYITTTGQTITIPAASSVAYPIGTTITFIAGSSATTTTIAINTDTLRLAGGTSTGSRTLAANGMATAVKVSGTSSSGVWYINGIGLT